MPSPIRIYLQTAGSEFRRLFWLQNNKKNEMLLGLYSLSGKPAVMRSMWPEYELSELELSDLSYKYDEAVMVNQAIDHITCHADGRFHVKTKNHEDLYTQRMQRTEPLGPDTSVFLEFILISDVAKNYAVISGAVKYPHVWFGLSRDSYVGLRGMFAGANYHVEEVMLNTMSMFAGQHGATVLTSGSIKGILSGQPKVLPDSAKLARPKGTILSFKFPVSQGKWHIKTFLFE